jgi:hypothetical protein
MRDARLLLSGLFVIATAACGGGGGGTTPTPTPAQLTVAGNYPTAVALLTDACGGSQVQSNPTTVTHTAGTTSLQLGHAGSTYVGTISNDGKFTTTPWTGTIGGSNYTVALTGQFSTTGFTATVTVDRVDSTHPTGCRYTVSWTATKSGSPNVIPG